MKAHMKLYDWPGLCRYDDIYRGVQGQRSFHPVTARTGNVPMWRASGICRRGPLRRGAPPSALSASLYNMDWTCGLPLAEVMGARRSGLSPIRAGEKAGTP